MMNGKISILMPVYNASIYLRQCIDSILTQSIDDWELIAVDDFSSDDSYDILKEYEHHDERILVLENTTKGIIPALTLAYKHSSGDYITRMDADDIMTVDKLKYLRQAVLDHPGHCATALVEYFSEEGMQEGYLKYASWLNSLESTEDHYRHIYEECVLPSPCWMMDRNTFQRVGATDFRQYPEDYDLVFRMYKYGVPIVKVNEILHRWRDHGSRASRNDPHYADQHFFDIKLRYFLELDRHPVKELVIWGTGKTGKALARELLDRKVSFRWITNNTKKVGLHVYDVLIENQHKVLALSNLQVITAVKEKGFKTENKQFFKKISKENDFLTFV